MKELITIFFFFVFGISDAQIINDATKSQTFNSIPEFYNYLGFKKSEYDTKEHLWRFIKYYKDAIIEEIITLDSTYQLKKHEVFFMNGFLLYSQELKGKPLEDVLDGKFIEYYDSVIVKRKGEYFNSFRSGKWTEYFPNGNKKSEGIYLLSKEDSLNDSKGNYSNDLKNRILNDTIIYGKDFIVDNSFSENENGETKFVSYPDTLFRKDIRVTFATPKEGIWKYWNNKGELIKEEYYRNGTLKNKPRQN